MYKIAEIPLIQGFHLGYLSIILHLNFTLSKKKNSTLTKSKFQLIDRFHPKMFLSPQTVPEIFFYMLNKKDS